jgi:hypothetical protein
MNALVERLIVTHRYLNREIQREMARRTPDPFRLTHLKKRRLAIKDQLVRHLPDASDLTRAARSLFAKMRREVAARR